LKSLLAVCAVLYYEAIIEYVEFCKNGTDAKCFSKKVIDKKCSKIKT